ncbi:hypothetical protein [Streptosporangium sandarakinum]
MAKQSFSEALAGLSVEEMSVDEEGRVTISDPETARRLRDAIGPAAAAAEPTNTSHCSPNTSNCSPNVARCNPT